MRLTARRVAGPHTLHPEATRVSGPCPRTRRSLPARPSSTPNSSTGTRRGPTARRPTRSRSSTYMAQSSRSRRRHHIFGLERRAGPRRCSTPRSTARSRLPSRPRRGTGRPGSTRWAGAEVVRLQVVPWTCFAARAPRLLPKFGPLTAAPCSASRSSGSSPRKILLRRLLRGTRTTSRPSARILERCTLRGTRRRPTSVSPSALSTIRTDRRTRGPSSRASTSVASSAPPRSELRRARRICWIARAPATCVGRVSNFQVTSH